MTSVVIRGDLRQLRDSFGGVVHTESGRLLRLCESGRPASPLPLRSFPAGLSSACGLEDST